MLPLFELIASWAGLMLSSWNASPEGNEFEYLKSYLDAWVESKA